MSMRYVGEIGRQSPDNKVRWASIVSGALLFLTPTSTMAAADLAGEVVSVEGTAFIRADARASAGAPKPAKGGDPIRQGDVLNTASDGKVKIMMKDRTIVDIGPSALFKIDEFKANQGANREVKINMMYGSVRASVSEKLKGKGKFQIRTPAAIMGVRGTEFIVKSEVPSNLKTVAAAIANPEKPAAPPAAAVAGASSGGAAKTEITVVQGRVDVEQKPAAKSPGSAAPKVETVALTAGTQLVAKTDAVAPAKAVQVDTAQMAAITSSVKVQDNTFAKAVVVDTGNGGGSGEATKAVLGNAIIVSAAPPINLSNMGFAGTFGVRDALGPAPINTSAGQLRTIKVFVEAP